MENDTFLNELVQDYAEKLSNRIETTDKFEHYAPGHARRVAENAIALAEKIGLSDEEVRTIKAAALLHDIGEVVQRHKFYGAPRPLELPEEVEMWQHSIIGEREVDRRGFGRPEQLIVRWHHEWWNGTGYPDFLFGWDVPLGSRIIRMADTWDALTHDRPWRKAFSREDALLEMQQMSGIEFDPSLVPHWLELAEEGKLSA